jgi:galactokinase
VTPDALYEQLVRGGFSADEALSRASLFAWAEGALRNRGNTPSWRWFVPGRIEVFGKHTDYAGGRSLVSAVPRGIAVVAAPRDDERVRVFDVIDQTAAIVDASDSTTEHRGWERYIAVVVRRLAANFPGARLGVDLAIASDLPRDAGLSSSSALIVAVATALIRRGRLDDLPEWRHAIESPHALAWYLGCIENGGDYPGLSGTSGVGTFGGSEDHTAILTCRADHLTQNRYLPVTPLGHVALPKGWTFVVGITGVRAHKAGNARDRYNRLSLAAEALRTLWNSVSGHAPAASLGAALATAVTARDELVALTAQPANPAFSAEDLERRLEHFIREDGRVPEAARAFAAADADRLAELAAASQRDADVLLGNQIPETRELVETALQLNARAAAGFGAGFGGSVWALVSKSDVPRFATDWIRLYARRFPEARDAMAFAAHPSPARIEIRDTDGVPRK